MKRRNGRRACEREKRREAFSSEYGEISEIFDITAVTPVPKPEQTHLKAVWIEGILRRLYGTLHDKHETRVGLSARLKDASTTRETKPTAI